MTRDEMIEIRKRLDWPHMSASDRELLEAVIERAAAIMHETGDPATFREAVYDVAHSFFIDAGRAMQITSERSQAEALDAFAKTMAEGEAHDQRFDLDWAARRANVTGEP